MQGKGKGKGEGGKGKGKGKGREQAAVPSFSQPGNPGGFKTHLARAIHNSLLEPPAARRKLEIFMPGRMAFEFNLDAEFRFIYSTSPE